MQTLQNKLKNPQSKAAIAELAKEVVADYANGKTTPLKMLMLLATRNQKGSWRAAWACRMVAELQPELLLKYRFKEQIALFLPRCTESGHRRILLLLLVQLPLPAEPPIALIDYCLALIASPKEKPALQVNALKYLYKVAESVPEFMRELKVVLEESYTYNSSSGLRAAKNLILSKINSFQKYYEQSTSRNSIEQKQKKREKRFQSDK